MVVENDIFRKGIHQKRIDMNPPLFFEIIVHIMEAFVVLGIATSVYFVRKTRKKNGNRGLGRHGKGRSSR